MTFYIGSNSCPLQIYEQVEQIYEQVEQIYEQDIWRLLKFDVFQYVNFHRHAIFTAL
jgi:hypothetical protein